MSSIHYDTQHHSYLAKMNKDVHQRTSVTTTEKVKDAITELVHGWWSHLVTNKVISCSIKE